MMKATAWFCPVLLTLLCATRFVCTAPRRDVVGAVVDATAAGGYPLDYLDAQLLQDEYSMVKRNKPSLSIVNPLDVLRQRLLLEIARRQMKENTRQVELNRAILKNVGKRMFLEPGALRGELRQPQHLPSSQLWGFGWPQTDSLTNYPLSSASSSSTAASSRFFDFLQRPQAQARRRPVEQQQLGLDAKNSLNAGGYGLGLGMTTHRQLNGNEIANETNHENHGNRKLQAVGKASTGDDSEQSIEDQDDMLEELGNKWSNEQNDNGDSSIDVADVGAENANAPIPWRLLYRMHKNAHYAN
ncbi:uncharacterized protein LOC108603919 [Drosophila busckii]|uniref:uncharacterized protein LOC108603919 n=1 Tax=Drosophila busckii TaxID=30019 RepID=UPI00083F0953|nr:uncharacterized protein LOC108603919 [Drosophila busckii]XP_017848599.1 uncharacterized protein LOC108603919 [Drosophila busckii]